MIPAVELLTSSHLVCELSFPSVLAKSVSLPPPVIVNRDVRLLRYFLSQPGQYALEF